MLITINCYFRPALKKNTIKKYSPKTVKDRFPIRPVSAIITALMLRHTTFTATPPHNTYETSAAALKFNAPKKKIKKKGFTLF